MTQFGSFADDFYINVNLNTEMELPKSRETVLHFFDRVQRTYPEMGNFYTRENGDFVLEEDKERGKYRWVSLESRRVCSGSVNPDSLTDSNEQHEFALDLLPCYLSVSALDCEAMDVLFGFDFTYRGNHDELIQEALGVSRSFESMTEISGARVLNYEPSITLALDEDCRLQCRISMETRTSAFQIRTGEFQDDQISLYFTVRQYWGHEPQKTFIESFHHQASIGEELLESYVVPNVVRPLAQAISAK